MTTASLIDAARKQGAAVPAVGGAFIDLIARCEFAGIPPSLTITGAIGGVCATARVLNIKRETILADVNAAFDEMEKRDQAV
jgi:hypothetical protein